jgi:hypothetical protein
MALKNAANLNSRITLLGKVQLPFNFQEVAFPAAQYSKKLCLLSLIQVLNLIAPIRALHVLEREYGSETIIGISNRGAGGTVGRG